MGVKWHYRNTVKPRQANTRWSDHLLCTFREYAHIGDETGNLYFAVKWSDMLVWVNFCLLASRNIHWQLYRAFLDASVICPMFCRTENVKVGHSSCAWSPGRASSPHESVSVSSLSPSCTFTTSLACTQRWYEFKIFNRYALIRNVSK